MAWDAAPWSETSGRWSPQRIRTRDLANCWPTPTKQRLGRADRAASWAVIAMVDEGERLFPGFDPLKVECVPLYDLRDRGAKEVWGIDQRPRRCAVVEALGVGGGPTSQMAVIFAGCQNSEPECGHDAVGLLKPDERDITFLPSGTQIDSLAWKPALNDFRDAVSEGRVVRCDRSYQQVDALFREIQEARTGRGFNPLADPASLYPQSPALWRAALAAWVRISRCADLVPRKP